MGPRRVLLRNPPGGLSGVVLDQVRPKRHGCGFGRNRPDSGPQWYGNAREDEQAFQAKRLGNLPSLRRQFTLPQMLLLLRGRGLALVFLVLLRHRRFGLIRRDSRLRSIGSDDW